MKDINSQKSSKELTAISASKEALSLLQRLKKLYPNLLLYLSAGCCEGSAIIASEDFKLGENDLLLAEFEGVKLYTHRANFKAFLEGQSLRLEAIKGRGSEFSLDYELGEYLRLNSACTL